MSHIVGMKKHALVELLRSKLMLPSHGAAPPVPDVNIDVSVAEEPVAGPSAPNADDSSSDVAESDESDDDM